MAKGVTLKSVRDLYATFGFWYHYKDWESVEKYYKKMNMTLETKHIDAIAEIYYHLKKQEEKSPE